MKLSLNRKELKSFMRDIRIREAADDLPFSDDEIIDELILYFEKNACLLFVSSDADDKTPEINNR